MKFKKSVLAVAVVLSACGGGGGDTPVDPPVEVTTITGTAATGSPIKGTVTVIDATGKVGKSVQTSPADGTYTLDVAGLTAPFLIQIVGESDGKPVFLSSVATGVGQTVNITPLTDLIVSAASGVPSGAELLQSCATTSTVVGESCLTTLKNAADATKLAQAKQKIVDMLNSLKSTGLVDPLNGAFKADGTGLDAVLDNILVTPATSGQPQATVTLVSSNTVIGTVDMPQSAGQPGAISVTPPTADQIKQAGAAASVIPEIKSCLVAFNALYPTNNFTPPTAEQVSPFFTDDFRTAGLDKAALVSILTSNSDFAVAGLRLGVAGLSTFDLSPLTSSEISTLKDLGAGGVLRARENGGAPVKYGISGAPYEAWATFTINGDATNSGWKFVKGAAYAGCAAGWKIAGTKHVDMHMNARVAKISSSDSAVSIERQRAFHLNKASVDTWAAFKGVPTIDSVVIRGPGLVVYSGNKNTPVGDKSPLVLNRPAADSKETVFQVQDLTAWNKASDAVQSCRDVAAASAPAGTPCIDERQVTPGAVYVWVLKSGSNVVGAFPYQINAIPLSKEFVTANDANIFATINQVAPSTVNAVLAAIDTTSSNTLDGLFKFSYTQGSAYRSKADNCNIRLTTRDGTALLVAEENAVGHETECTFNTNSLNSGSLAKPIDYAQTSQIWVSVATSVLGNQATNAKQLP